VSNQNRDPAEAALDATVAAVGEGGERWLIEFVAMDDPCPPAIRVRTLLKKALRGYSLKCVSVSSPPAPAPVSKS
jgi:hypothetical protein